MIRNFSHPGLKELFYSGKSRRIDKRLHSRIIRRLDFLNMAASPEQMNLPGFDYHKLQGKPVRYTVHVNGPICVTFGFDGEDAIDVNLEDYH
ncbi:MAG: type II toxin-antitoxin system RelE/ParE family toxin [Proteobacteria bacterium]|nr:type II toxin-antitoxin system RelE/ParE family toxin [Pseudomonadota bacterium]